MSEKLQHMPYPSSTGNLFHFWTPESQYVHFNFSLDSEQKPELILIIQKLLADRTVLVIGSAVMAFTKVCPERVDLIHHVFRKLCTLLVDVDEWGQIIIVNMLTRYARTQFADPNLNVSHSS